MMSFTQQVQEFDYLDWERQQEEKHELHNGRVVAMAGGTLAHAVLVSALSSTLKAGLGGKGCHVLTNDVKLKVDESTYFYPDVLVLCKKHSLDLRLDYAENPEVVVEVLSPSTEGRDLSYKFDRYRLLPSLKHIIYVWQDKAVVEIRSRVDDELWQISYKEGLEASFQIDEVTYRLAEIFEGIEFSQPKTPAPGP